MSFWRRKPSRAAKVARAAKAQGTVGAGRVPSTNVPPRPRKPKAMSNGQALPKTTMTKEQLETFVKEMDKIAQSTETLGKTLSEIRAEEAARQARKREQMAVASRDYSTRRRQLLMGQEDLLRAKLNEDRLIQLRRLSKDMGWPDPDGSPEVSRVTPEEVDETVADLIRLSQETES